MERAFGELRGILHAEASSSQLSEDAPEHALWELLMLAHAHDPARFDSAWRPYLRAHAHRLARRPLATCHSLQELADCVRFLPEGRFTLVLHAREEIAVLPSISSPDGSPVPQPIQTRTVFKEAVPAHDLANHPLLTNVHTLRFVRQPSRPASFARLFESPYITSLRALHLDKIELEPGDLSRLLAIKRPAQLTSLAITNTTEVNAYERALPSLALPHSRTSSITQRERLPLPTDQKPLLAGLEELDLSFCDLAGADHIAQWLGGALTNATCKRLVLRGNNLTREGLEQLARSPNMGALTSLDLSYNAVSTCKRGAKNKSTSDGYGALLESTHLQHLAHLDLSHNASMHRAEYDALSTPPPNLSSLQSFVCEGTRIIEDGVMKRFLHKLGWSR